MIPITKAIIHKDAVMVKLLHAPIAMITVQSCLGSQIFTVYTQVVNLNVLLQ
jgi:hypothetical protein